MYSIKESQRARASDAWKKREKQEIRVAKWRKKQEIAAIEVERKKIGKQEKKIGSREEKQEAGAIEGEEGN